MLPRRSLLTGPFAVAGLAIFAAPVVAAETVDLTTTVVITPPDAAGPESKAAQMLVDEVGRRSHARWERADTWPTGKPVVVVGPADGAQKLLAEHGVRLAEPKGRAAAEGYRIGVAGDTSTPLVWVAGNDPRGTLFGVGRLLRELRIERTRVTLPAGFRDESTPQTSLRGHQLGYRPKTNSYDGWTVAMWEQYIRDLVVFGCNAIELIPPRSDDAADSSHFPLPPLRMMTEVSRIADAYGIAVWAWYPAMDADYANPKTVEFAINEWGEIFKALPRLDVVFVPGGDPGHTRPKVLFDLLEKQAANLRKYHPKGQMWVSPQSFDRERLDEFIGLLKAEPAWLTGIAAGPQVRVDLPELRKLVPAKYPIRDYPDITHSRHCQYPVPDWDVAFALTIGREGSNPRPTQMAAIYRHARPHTNGFITYSEGCHDDVNKMIWSALGWDERADVREVLRQYARYFIGPEYEDRFADGLLGLEKNWIGPVLDNAGIDDTLAQFRIMERDASPAVKLNWRFQQALYRAYYDGYIRARIKHETDADSAARSKLRDAKTTGSLNGIAEAVAILDRAAKEPAGRDLRARVGELAEALFQSIHAQLSVRKYRAIAVERGATLDTIDIPLTDAAWLRKQLAEVRKLPDEAAQLTRLDGILNRSDPGPGGFYDDMGDPKRQPHLVRGPAWEKDPAFYASPLVGFGFRGAGPGDAPRAWWHHAETLFDQSLSLRYPELDSKARYRVRVVYGGERARKVRLTANHKWEVHGYLAKPLQELEFEVPPAATAGGALTLSWSPEPGAGGTGRGCQVAEVWLLKKPAGD